MSDDLKNLFQKLEKANEPEAAEKEPLVVKFLIVSMVASSMLLV